MSGFSIDLHLFLIFLLFIQTTTFLILSRLKAERFLRKFLIGSISSKLAKNPHFV